MTTPHNSYCMPKTDEEWRLITNKSYTDTPYVYVGAVTPLMMLRKKVSENDTEISVSKFLDLLHDRIVPWRLEEIGFINRVFDHTLVLQHVWNEVLVQRVITVCGSQNNIVVRFDGELVNITTFTDLLTLIKFLTPPTK